MQKPVEPRTSPQGMILVITLVLIAIIGVLSLGIIKTGLLQEQLGQGLVNANISKHGGLSLVLQLIKEGETDKSLNNWFIKAQAQPLDVCLTEQSLIKQNCNTVYDAHNDIVVTGNLVFTGTQADWLLFDFSVEVKRAAIEKLLRQTNYQLLFQWQTNDQISLQYK